MAARAYLASKKSPLSLSLSKAARSVRTKAERPCPAQKGTAEGGGGGSQPSAPSSSSAATPAPTTTAKRRRSPSPSRGGYPPAFRPPQLATLVDAVPAGNGWIHVIKFDGYRALIDGEIVAYDKDGNADFSSLPAVLKRGHGARTDKTPLSFHAFDVLEIDGADQTGLTNIERKERLEALLAAAKPPIHVADHVIGAGEKLFKAMCDAGQEGIISKRIDGKYSGKRSKTWLKVKCTRRQEFVIVRWKKSSARARFRRCCWHRTRGPSYATSPSRGGGQVLLIQAITERS